MGALVLSLTNVTWEEGDFTNEDYLLMKLSVFQELKRRGWDHDKVTAFYTQTLQGVFSPENPPPYDSEYITGAESKKSNPLN